MNDPKYPPENHWLADAANIDSSSFDLDKYIAITASITEFTTSNKFIVAAPKGYGKTLLLKYKRVNNKEKHNDSKTIIIPNNIEIDTFDSPIRFDKNFETFLENQFEWENIWQIALGLSIILNFSAKKGEDGEDFLTDFLESFEEKNNKLSTAISITRKFIQRIKSNQTIPSHIKTQANPSNILANLLNSSLSDLRASTSHALHTIHTYCLSIDQPIYVYIDQIDQAVKDFPVKLWRNAQNGLVGAIFRLHNPNKHIKIYASIRIEAWDFCVGELYSQYGDYVCVLNYIEMDLKRIFEHAVLTYESEKTVRSASVLNSDPIQAFTGLDGINNTWGNEKEEVFKYMLRHSLQRPRDLILLGGGVHSLFIENRLNEEEFCKMVNRVPGEEVHHQYMLETLRFSESLINVNTDRFFSLITKNIYSLSEMIDVCSRYNSDVHCGAKLSQSANPEACKHCTAANHIFCDLYRVGLLGIIRTDEIKKENNRTQHFKKPGYIRSEHLPTSSFYVLHPAMDYYIKDELYNNNYAPIRGIIVGDNRIWHNNYDALIVLGKIDYILKEYSQQIPENIKRTHQELAAQIFKSNTAPQENKQISEKIMNLKNLITSDGLLAAANFSTTVLSSLEKLQTLMK